MNPEALGLLFNVLSVALALFALWVAGRIVLRNLSIIQNKISPSRAIQLLIWLALGEILILSFLDFIGLIQLFTTLSSEAGEAYTLWGRVPPLIYDLFVGFTTLFIYGFTMILGWEPLIKRVPPILESIQLNSFEKVLGLLVIAGLVNHVVRFVVSSVIWQQTPLEVQGLEKGITGFIAGWLVGLLIIGIAIYVMYEQIERQTEKMGEISE